MMRKHITHQMNVYEYLDKEEDHLFALIFNIQQGKSQYIPEIQLTLMKNQHGLYEIVSGSRHECYSSKEALYDRVNEIMDYIMLKGSKFDI
ncbi:hypothetical protein [Virgibacillus dakarensis]|uniref:hypothetical protein n=1 Tax=Virgibacillus dakarensis TaxID=1917889 RepID=UPI001F2F9104|nr:hypothetical protein [Virgibacillus dakarensis]